MKIALIQTNPVIGDFDFNCNKIVAWAEKAYTCGCRLAMFPEMAVSGYPPQDLLERTSFVAAQKKAVAALPARLPDIDVLFGCFSERREPKGKKLYNSAVVARQGEIIFQANKQLLPTYDVFDETRYFEPGDATELYVLDGHCFGVTVCEDIWHHEVEDYSREPVAQLYQRATLHNQRLQAVLNISASPFHLKKERKKHAMLSELCRRYQTSLLYVNQVGGQDALLFDGRSLAMNNRGQITAKAAGFKEDMLIVDTVDWNGLIKGSEVDDETEAVYAGLVMGVRDYIRKSGFSQAVLGVSGGIDSALTAAIAVDALGAENVMAVALPSAHSSSHSREDAEKLALALGCRYSVIPIKDLYEGFEKTLAPLFAGFEEDLTEQNLQARIRGNILMALSNKFGSILLTTGNKSEMAVGYCTLYGDMSGGLAVIADVPKRLVYKLAQYVNREKEIIPWRSISKPPSAELKPGQLDQDDLPPYDVLDSIVELHLEEGMGFADIVNEGYDESTVRDILRRIRVNEYKRKQAPLGLKVTSKAFGYGRRYPNVQNFQE
ncbi:MAG: NAD+ synthase [Desulfopila sp.]|jgi:NAD+ synthetase|nr:NAD+ synthase [Desulfopila sp.]